MIKNKKTEISAVLSWDLGAHTSQEADVIKFWLVELEHVVEREGTTYITMHNEEILSILKSLSNHSFLRVV